MEDHAGEGEMADPEQPSQAKHEASYCHYVDPLEVVSKG